MANKEILYVTYDDEPLDDGFSYAIYLAGLMGEKLRVVLLDRNGSRLEDVLTAVTFAEANEHETAREFMEKSNHDSSLMQNTVVNRCRDEGINVNVHSGLNATVSVIRKFIGSKNIDFVLLSPLVTASRHILSKLQKTSPRPVVTLARASARTALSQGGNC